MQLAKNARAVSAAAICNKGVLIATADKSNDHVITVFKIDSGEVVFECKGGPDPIHDLAFSNNDDTHCVWAAGVKAMQHVKYQEQKKKKVLFNGNPSTSFACVTADDQGNAYSGGANSLIYVVAGNSVKQTLNFHEGGGFVGAISWVGGKLYSGSKDGKILITDTSSMSCI